MLEDFWSYCAPSSHLFQELTIFRLLPYDRVWGYDWADIVVDAWSMNCHALFPKIWMCHPGAKRMCREISTGMHVVALLWWWWVELLWMIRLTRNHGVICLMRIHDEANFCFPRPRELKVLLRQLSFCMLRRALSRNTRRTVWRVWIIDLYLESINILIKAWKLDIWNV